MTVFEHIKNVIQLFILGISLFFNTLLIYFVVTKASKKLGNYRHLMCYFSTISMIYTVIDFIVKPYIHSHGASFSMIMDMRGRDWDPTIAFSLVFSLCGCFGITIYAIAINFIFRFFALERKGRLQYFNNNYLILWFLLPLFASLIWASVCWSTMYQTPELTEYLRENIKENYGLDADNITYTGAYFYQLDENGEVRWNIESCVGALVLNVLMTFPLMTILVFGTKSYKIVQKLTDSGMSDYAKNLQMQLYKALVAQTIIPMVFLFFPIGILFSAPLFHADIERASPLVTFFYALYPAVDPIPIIFFIDDFRIAFFGIFFCFPSPRSKNQVASHESGESAIDAPS